MFKCASSSSQVSNSQISIRSHHRDVNGANSEQDGLKYDENEGDIMRSKDDESVDMGDDSDDNLENEIQGDDSDGNLENEIQADDNDDNLENEDNVLVQEQLEGSKLEKATCFV